ncbi:MAG TPA: tetratricopeptide repeat protein [Bryobacteraceae bacterium]|nr:tetratricopeptide repeat protein [Bryobacteraceae bacterium]
MYGNQRLWIAVGLAGALILVPETAICQRPGGGGGAGGGGTAPGPANPGRPTNPPNIPNNPNSERTQGPFGDLQNRPVFLSGKVQMDDGTAPPDLVLIERVCGNTPHAEAYTDSKGHFNFQLGQNSGIMQDASYSSALDVTTRQPEIPGPRTNQQQSVPGARNTTIGERDLIGCELRAVLPGYRSDLVNLSGRRMFDNPEVGTIILHRLTNVEGTTISATTLAAPKDAKKAYDKARQALLKNKIPEAQKDLEKAVAAYPPFAAAWYELGRIHENQNQMADARECYAKALNADAKFVSPYLQLALISARDKKWQDVADETSRLVKLNPVDFPQAFYYNSVANYNLRRFDAAEASAREAQKLDPAHRMPNVEHILGAILYEKKDYTGAAEQMRSYLQLAPNAADAGQVRSQLSELEKLAGEAKARAESSQK